MTTRGESQPTGVVFNVQRSSFHDGPGIRTTVFLKGCPLRCPWCHNPESVSARPQVIVNEARCISCGACTEACPRVGGPLPSGATIGSDGCTACHGCFDSCPALAREPVGRERTVQDVTDEVLRDRLAYEISSGGVTFSGGEPLAQLDFLLACLEACRFQGIRTAVDTCGAAPREAVLAAARRTDLLLWDIKHLDPRKHLQTIGAPLEPILDNLTAAAGVNVPIWLRVPVIPGYNDDDDATDAVTRLAASLPQIERISLLPYHRTGTAKGARLGKRAIAAPYRTPSQERMEEMASRLAQAGIETTIGG